MGRRHVGFIKPCDIDPGTRKVISHASKRYPGLKILCPGTDVNSTVKEFVRVYGIKELGAVDIDLTASIPKVWETAKPVIEELRICKYRGKVLLTFRNGRDSFNSVSSRIDWLVNQLPKGIVVSRAESYTSDHYDRFGRYNKGSAMCVVELQY